MNYPKPYFKGLPKCGDLELDYIFVELECPILFTCRDLENNIYLCICCDIIDEQRWIVAPIKPKDLIRLIDNQLTFYDFYKNAKQIYKIIWKKGYKTEKVYDSSFSECVGDIPPKGEYLDSEIGEFVDYVDEIKDLIKRDSMSKEYFGSTEYKLMFFYPLTKKTRLPCANAQKHTISYDEGGYSWRSI